MYQVISCAGNFLARLLLRALPVCAFIQAGSTDAYAQQSDPLSTSPGSILSGIEILATPYLWLPWTSAHIRPSNTRLPSASSTIDPGKLISHLTWVPFMGQAEIRSS